MNKKTTISDDKKAFTVEYTFPTNVKTVWDALYNKKDLTKWWGPHGWDATVKHMDFKEGGSLLYGMKCVDPEQKDFFGQWVWGISKYNKIKREHYVEYTDEFCDEDGITDENTPPMVIRNEFIDEKTHTKVVNTTVFDSQQTLEQMLEMGVDQGFIETCERLEAYLADSKKH